MSLEALLTRVLNEQTGAVTPVTAPETQTLQREPLRHKAVTAVTAQNSNELRRAKVLADLRTHPAIIYAADVDGTSDPVTIVLAIRDIGTCTLEVDAARWNPLEFLALMERSRLEVAA